MTIHSEPEFGQLSRLADDLSLSEASFQALLYRLSPQQRRLFALLVENGSASTIEVRNRCSIGNPSFVADQLNKKLEAAGDPRRVLCEMRRHENHHGNVGVLGWWTLVDVSRPPANDSAALSIV